MSSSDENNDLDSVDTYLPKEESELEAKINELSNAGLYKFAFFSWLFDTMFYVYEKVFGS